MEWPKKSLIELPEETSYTLNMMKTFKIFLERQIWTGKRYGTESKRVEIEAETLWLAKEKAEQTNPSWRMTMGWPI